jgi:hypothetical protein
VSYNKQIVLGLVIAAVIGPLILYVRDQLTVPNLCLVAGAGLAAGLMFWLWGRNRG